jgi:hypothetical protein
MQLGASLDCKTLEMLDGNVCSSLDMGCGIIFEATDSVNKVALGMAVASTAVHRVSPTQLPTAAKNPSALLLSSGELKFTFLSPMAAQLSHNASWHDASRTPGAPGETQPLSSLATDDPPESTSQVPGSPPLAEEAHPPTVFEMGTLGQVETAGSDTLLPVALSLPSRLNFTERLLIDRAAAFGTTASTAK